MDTARFEVREVDRDRWDDLAALFEARGGPHYCWCMAWRKKPANAESGKAGLKAALHSRVADGIPIGLLAYCDGRPVAWCSIAPRSSYRRLGGPGEPDEENAVWSLVCFFVKREFRGQGLPDRLIRAAIDHAKGRGAKVVEAYPVDPDSPSYRFMGVVNMFEKAGFKLVGQAGTRRHVMRIELI